MHFFRCRFVIFTTLAFGILSSQAKGTAPACGILNAVMSFEQIKRIVEAKTSRDYEVYTSYHALHPEQLTDALPSPQQTIYVNSKGQAARGEDGLAFSKDGTEILGGIRLDREDDMVKTLEGQELRRRQIRYIRQHRSFSHPDHPVNSLQLSKISVRTQPVVNYGVGKLSKEGLSASSPSTIPLEELDYFRHRLIDILAASYAEDLPPATWRDLHIQEFGLASHRSFEVAVVQGPHLVGFARLYDLTPTGDEDKVFDLEEPFVRVEIDGQKWRDIPTYIGPLERSMKPEVMAAGPVNRLRNDPRYYGQRLLELGRFFINKEVLNPAARKDVKEMIFTMLVGTMEELAPDGDFRKVHLLANGAPANARAYRANYGFEEIGIVKADDMKSINNVRVGRGWMLFDVNFRDHSNWSKGPKPDDAESDIILMQTSASDFRAKLKEQGYMLKYGPGKWTTLLAPSMFLPREFFSGNPLK